MSDKKLSKLNRWDFSNNSISVFEDFNDSDTLVIAFWWIADKLWIPVFEFFWQLEKFNVSKMFIRDLNRSWYHQWLKNKTNSIAETVQFINSKREELQVKNTIFIWASAWWYWAILFWMLIPNARVLAFMPQTYINPLSFLNKLMFRWRKLLFSRLLTWKLNYKYLDINNIENTTSFFEIHYSNNHEIDCYQAERFKHRNVTVIAHDTDTHNISKYLKNQWNLKNILEKFIAKK